MRLTLSNSFVLMTSASSSLFSTAYLSASHMDLYRSWFKAYSSIILEVEAFTIILAADESSHF
jgi:hypothetical protein